jgi:uncharacterized protein YdaU (DUF1376 family)
VLEGGVREKSPAFQFYPADWLSSRDVLLMTPAEEGAYIHMLALAWLEIDCGLPDDDRQLAQLSRLGTKAWKRSSTILRSKFRSEGGRLFNDRLLQEREKQEVWRRKSSEGGKLSAATKRKGWFKGGSRVVEKCLQPNLNSSSSSSSSSSKNTLPTLSPAKNYGPAWDRFEREYPGEVIPDRDCRVFISVIQSENDEALLFGNLPFWLETRKFRDGYAPAAHKFLFDGHWKVKPKPERNTPPAGPVVETVEEFDRRKKEQWAREAQSKAARQ